MLYNPKAVIHIDPNDIKYISPVWETQDLRLIRAKELGCEFQGNRLTGDWDLKCEVFNDREEFNRLNTWKDGGEKGYRGLVKWEWNWENLSESIKKNGYVQHPEERCVEVAIGRNGEYYFVDGIHRIILARDMGIESIPVEVVYIHKDYNFDNLSSIKNYAIPEFVQNLITAKWEKGSTLYQTPEWMGTRYGFMKKSFDILQDKKVLDIGCNGFLSAWQTMKFAKSLVGIEQNEEFYKQGKKTLECLKSRWKVGDVKIRHTSLEEYMMGEPDKFNAFLGICILYWLTPDDLTILIKKVIPKCGTIFLASRLSDNPAYRNPFELNKPENIIAFVQSQGFEIVSSRQGNGIVFVTGKR